MKHYIHHLLFDPLGLFEQMLRDSGLALVLIVVGLLVIFIGSFIFPERKKNKWHH